MSHSSVAKSVRERKEARPELYCANPRCLWSLRSGPCPKHPAPKPPAPAHDFRIQNHGSVILVEPLVPALREHLEANVGDEAQWFGGSLVVEPRYLSGIVYALLGEGFSMEPIGGRS